jgi:hypothetical protein
MKTKSERFVDSRVDRFAHMPYERSEWYCDSRRAHSRRHSELYKAVRLDKRFALVALYWATCDSVNRTVLNLMDTHGFEQDAGIPAVLINLCAAHRAKCDPTKIACYPTRADAKRGREVVMSAGRFFTATLPHWTESQVRAAAEAFAEAAKPLDVKFAESADEMANVYCTNRGFTSCMSRFDNDDEHPARFYAYPGNGLRIAYLEKQGETVARSIVNIDRKLYVRVYGDARLASALESQGYTLNARAALNGVKCAAHEYSGRLVAPYLDAIQHVEWDGRSGYCTITADGNYECDNTDGFAGECYSARCEHCDERVNEDDTVYSEHHEIMLCDSCAGSRYTYAVINTHGHRDHVRDDLVVWVRNTAYLDDCEVLENAGFVLVGDEWCDGEECTYLEYLGEYVKHDDCVTLDVAFGDDCIALESDTMTVTLNGEQLTVHEDYEGPTDEKMQEARRIARAIVAKRCRKFSRGPRKPNRRASAQRQNIYKRNVR